MSAPSLPDQTAPRSPARPGTATPTPETFGQSSTSADSERGAPDGSAIRPVDGVIRLASDQRGMPTWLKWLPVSAVLAIGGLMLNGSRPEAVRITGGINAIMNPIEVLPVFTEVVDEEPADAPGAEAADDASTDEDV